MYIYIYILYVNTCMDVLSVYIYIHMYIKLWTPVFSHGLWNTMKHIHHKLYAPCLAAMSIGIWNPPGSTGNFNWWVQTPVDSTSELRSCPLRILSQLKNGKATSSIWSFSGAVRKINHPPIVCYFFLIDPQVYRCWGLSIVIYSQILTIINHH